MSLGRGTSTSAGVYEIGAAREARTKAIESFPRNRLGEPPAWGLWVVTRAYPGDPARVCAICGRAGISPAEARALYSNLWARSRLLTDLEFLDQVAQIDGQVRGRREDGALLARFDLSLLPEFLQADASDLDGWATHACPPCAERETQRALACGGKKG